MSAVARFAVRSGARHVVLASSGKVYEPGEGAIAEERPTRPETPLGRLKLLQERNLGATASRGEFGVTALRIFNAYGPGQANGFLVPHLMSGWGGPEPIPVGELAHQRDWVHVDDVSQAVLRALEHPPKAGRLRALNVGTGRSYAVSDIAEELARLPRSRSGARRRRRPPPPRRTRRRAGGLSAPARARLAAGDLARRGAAGARRCPRGRRGVKVDFFFFTVDAPVGYSAGAAQLSQEVRDRGHDVRLNHVDGRVGLPWDPAALAARSAAWAPDVVALSFGSPHAGHARRLLAALQESLPAARVVVGGLHATLNPEEVAGWPGVTALGRGEADGTLADFVDAWARGEAIPDVPGFWIRQPDGRIVRRPMRLPPALDGVGALDDTLDYEAITRAGRGLASLSVTRGCPYRCSYCHNEAVLTCYARGPGPARVTNPLRAPALRRRRPGPPFVASWGGPAARHRRSASTTTRCSRIATGSLPSCGA